MDAATTQRRLWVITAEDGQLWAGSGQRTGKHRQGQHLRFLALQWPAQQRPADHRSRARLLTMYTPAGVAIAQFQEGGFMAPVGIDAAGVADQQLLAVSDSGACEVSLWQMPLADLP
ncbi:MAG: hypothetical protein R2856_03345 [Caldilineaceae bacterium]